MGFGRRTDVHYIRKTIRGNGGKIRGYSRAGIASRQFGRPLPVPVHDGRDHAADAADRIRMPLPHEAGANNCAAWNRSRT